MADAGSRKIKALLDDHSERLAKSMKTMGTGLFVSRKDPNPKVSQSTYRGIREVRAYYEDLAKQIRAVKTSSRVKSDVLDALKRFDSGLAGFAKGLREESTDDGRDQLRKASRRASSATVDLGRALRKLP